MGKINLIIGREFNTRVRKKSFIVITILMPLAILALMVVPALIQMYGGGVQQRTVVVVDSSGVMSGELVSGEAIEFENSTMSYPEVVGEYPDAFGFLLIGEDILTDPNSVKLYTAENSTLSLEGEIEGQLSSIITNYRIKNSGVEALDSIMQSVVARSHLSTYKIVKGIEGGLSGQASSSGVNMGVAYGAGFMIYMFILLYGMMVLSSVVEEKSSRVMEIMVSSVRPFELMMGKILGVASVAMLQFMIWVVLLVVGVMVFGAVIGGMPTEFSVVGDVLGDGYYLFKVLGGFVLYFVGGYLLYASMFAAAGSAAESTADTQQLQMPMTLPLIIALFIMLSVMQEPNSSLAFWASIIPFTSPVVMMARISYGVPLWEFLLSITLLYGTFIAMTHFAAKIYRVGIFMYGKRPTLRELIRWTTRRV